MQKQISGSPSFNNVENITVRAWNRISTFFNITRDFNLDRAKNYIAQFSLEDKQQMQHIFEDIRKNGYESAKRSVMRNHVCEDQLGDEAQLQQVPNINGSGS